MNSCMLQNLALNENISSWMSYTHIDQYNNMQLINLVFLLIPLKHMFVG